VKRKVFQIQMQTLRMAIDHLRVADLDELENCARQFGSIEDVVLILALRRMLPTLPTGHH